MASYKERISNKKSVLFGGFIPGSLQRSVLDSDCGGVMTPGGRCCVMVSQKSQNHRKVWVEGEVDVVVKNLKQIMPFNLCDIRHFSCLHFTKESKQNFG